MSYSSDDSVIKVSCLRKSFGSLPVLKGIDFSVPKGRMLALLGPNGAGKTTIIKILGTLLLPDEGEVFINGYDIKAKPSMVRRSIGVTGQFSAVDEYLTGRENLELMGRLYHLKKADVKRRADILLERFELSDSSGRLVRTYSGGMRRKLDLAACIIASPPVVFLDEPTTGLDPRSRLAMWEIIKEMMNAQITVLLTTQYLEEADLLAHRIAVLDEGRIIEEGSADELKNKVGGSRLEFICKDEDECKKAEDFFVHDEYIIDRHRRSISVSIDGTTDSIKNVLEKIEKINVTLESFCVRKPTLDDVFMHFTGHKAREKQNSKID